jgi:hypothetical protein
LAIMVLACVALLVSSTIGGLSQSVATYVIAAVALGGYFALSSGTVDSIVYDTVLEETGSSERYETWIGRVRMVESAAFVVNALAGRGAGGGDVGPHHLFRDSCRSRPRRSSGSCISRSPACTGPRSLRRCPAISP